MGPLANGNIKSLEARSLGSLDLHPLGYGLRKGLDGQTPELEEGQADHGVVMLGMDWILLGTMTGRDGEGHVAGVVEQARGYCVIVPGAAADFNGA